MDGDREKIFKYKRNWYALIVAIETRKNTGRILYEMGVAPKPGERGKDDETK